MCFCSKLSRFISFLYAELTTYSFVRFFLIIFVLLTSCKFNKIQYPIQKFVNYTLPTYTPDLGDRHSFQSSLWTDYTFVEPVSLLQAIIPSYIIAGKEGLLWRIEIRQGSSTKKLVLDIQEKVHSMDDAGLINSILHPQFGRNKRKDFIYLIYRYHLQASKLQSCTDPAFIRLSRFAWSAERERFDPESEYVLIQQYDPHCWHMGGGMFFDKAGFLFFTIGDAGGINDQFNSTQQVSRSFFGGLHRIDVDKDPERSHPIIRQPDQIGEIGSEISYTQGYLIPNDNPFVDRSGRHLDEFYALGLRNPHRISYDPTDDKIWVGDVGQASREEINIVEKGDNLQWPFAEGSVPGPHMQPSEIIGNSKGPIYEYDHSFGNAIIGGFVYRGSRFKDQLYGKYIFADDGNKSIYSFDDQDKSVDLLARILDFGIGPKNGISSLSTDDEGNIYILKLYGDNRDGGRIFKLELDSTTNRAPEKISEIAVFRDLETLTPHIGLRPYSVNVPAYSNGAIFSRWMAIPNDGRLDHEGEQIIFSRDGAWRFPIGSVFVQHFELPLGADATPSTRQLETRFLVIAENDEVYGLAYKWNEEGTEAFLVKEGHLDTLGINPNGDSAQFKEWQYLSPNECLVCHNSNAGYVLGVKAAQISKPQSDGTNQMENWKDAGLFLNTGLQEDVSSVFRLKKNSDPDASIAEKVRSHLDVNCAHCHHPGGVQAVFDARFSTTLEHQKLIFAPGKSQNTPPDRFLIAPQDVERSEIWQRVSSTGVGSMPPIVKMNIDTQFVRILEEWIGSLEVGL